MTLIDRSHAAVFESPLGVGPRQAFSEQRFHATAQARGSAFVRVKFETQSSTAGAHLRLGGVITLRGPQARLRFRHGACGKVDETLEPDVVDTPLLPAGTTMPLGDPTSARYGALPPGALVWISFVDASGAPLSSPICVGRAGREPLHIEPLFEIPVTVTAWLSARRLSKNGPILDLTGDLQFRDGVAMRVAHSVECDRFGAPSPAGRTFDVEVAARGGTLAIPQHRVSALVRGTPLVSLEIRDWDGRRAGVEMPVGWLTRLR